MSGVGNPAELMAWALADVARASAVLWPDKCLRPYQVPAARGIVQAALDVDGSTSAVVFSRQSGKDEMLAQALAFLAIRLQRAGGEVVMAQPSLIPQGQISMDRLEQRLLDARPLLASLERAGDVITVGKFSVRYMSAGPGAQARGATASRLLVANEAQDIEPDRWDAVFDPMGASTNAATVFSGTVWTNQTLLARAMQTVRRDRLYQADWRRVARDVPAYGRRVEQRIAELGAEHPFIRTEYRLLPLEGGGNLFDAGRIAQMHGIHGRIHQAQAGRTYALLLDVAGGEEETQDVLHKARETRSRDSTVATVVEVVRPENRMSPMQDPRSATEGSQALPVYRVVDRRVWTGTDHVTLEREVLDLARRVWRVGHVVVDATGIGHGLAAMLAAALPPGVVLPFVFSSHSKSDLGWRFLAAIGAGRYQEYADDGAAETREFWRQAGACTFAVMPGPGRLMHWSVPESDGHDDLLLSAALVGALDDLDWRPRVAVGRSA